MAKRYGRPNTDYLDEKRIKAIEEIRRGLPTIVEYGTEDDFVRLIKQWLTKHHARGTGGMD